MTFIEDWYPQDNLEALALLAEQILGLNGLIIEVGCWEGRSTVTLANTIYPEWITAIDTWLGSVPDGYTTEGRDVYKAFKQNINTLTAGNVRVFKNSWEKFDWKQPIKFLHIDGEHTFDAVYKNILSAKLSMVRGGIICGDDFFHEPVQKAVHEALGSVTVYNKRLWFWDNA